jgi:hypothetical protein
LRRAQQRCPHSIKFVASIVCVPRKRFGPKVYATEARLRAQAIREYRKQHPELKRLSDAKIYERQRRERSALHHAWLRGYLDGLDGAPHVSAVKGGKQSAAARQDVQTQWRTIARKAAVTLWATNRRLSAMDVARRLLEIESELRGLKPKTIADFIARFSPRRKPFNPQ